MASFTDGISAFTVDKNLIRNATPRVISFSFGDGYEQRVIDGINILEAQYLISINTRPKNDIKAINDFFESLQGVSSFSFHAPQLGELTDTISFSGNAITVSSGFSASVLSPAVPDRLVVTGSANNDGSYIIDSTGTNNDTTLTVVESLTTESSAPNVTVSAAIGVIAPEWSMVYNYGNFWSINATLKRIHDA